MIKLSLFLYILSAIIIISFFKSKILRGIFAVFFSTFFVLQLSSLYLGGEFIDYRYFLHFNLKSLSMAGAFVKQIILTGATLVILPCLLYFGSKLSSKLSKFLKLRKFKFIGVGKILILIATILILWLPERGMYNKFKEIFVLGSLTSEGSSDFEKLLSDLEQKGNGTKFTAKEDLQAEFGEKNIIIISLESFEKALLADKNRDLTPNLRTLSEEWNFYPMQPQRGSCWTAGSLYTAFSGTPCFIPGFGNDFFYGSKKNKMVNLGDVLKQCGYEMYHISGDATFAGTKDMLKVFGIEHILDGVLGKKNLPQMPIGGCYDKDIFEKAKHVLTDRNNEKPFMLWLSTTQFHSPDGYVDERLLPITKQRNTNLATVAAATDYLVDDFIKFLQNNDLLKNTVVYIMPDHLFMGNNSLFDTGEPRQLWLMTNAEKADLTIDTTNFYQIDLVKQFILGAKIKHNAVFFTDIIEDNKNDFILANAHNIKTLNMSAFIIENTISENFIIKQKDNKVACLVNNEILFLKSIKELKNQSVFISLGHAFNIISVETVKNNEEKILPVYIKISMKNKDIHFEILSYSGYKYEKISNRIELNSEDISKIYSEIEKFDDTLISYTSYPYGEVKNKINYSDASLIAYLAKVLKDSNNVVLMSCHDEAGSYFDKVFPTLQRCGLKIDLSGKFRWSYFSVFSSNKVYTEMAEDGIWLWKKFNINANDGLKSPFFIYLFYFFLLKKLHISLIFSNLEV